MDSSSHRPHSIAALTVAVGAVVGGAYWMLRSGGRDDEPTRSASGTTSSAHIGTAVDGESERATRAPAEDASDFGVPPCEPGPPDGLLVRVVAEADGRPVAGARVYAVPDPDSRTGALFDVARPLVEDPRRLGAAHARGYLADAKGEARIVVPAFDVLLFGMAGELRGAARLYEAGRGTMDLRLLRACDVLVEVVDSNEAPVRDVRVALAAHHEPDPALKGEDHWAQWIQYDEGAASDGRGRARLIGVDLVRARQLQLAARSGKYVIGALVPYVGSSKVRGWVEFDEAAPPEKPVRVRLDEPYGALEVRVVDASGRARKIGGDVQVEVGRPRGTFVFSGRREIDGGSIQRRPIEQGVARIAPVALGARFVVSARLEGGKTVKRSIDGPSAAGEVVRVDFDPELDRRVLRGRLVGLPLPHGPIPGMVGDLTAEAALPESKRDDAASRVRTPREPMGFPIAVDARDDGTFEIDVSSHDGLRIAAIVLRGFERAHAVGFEARVTPPEELVEPVTDVGDVAVEIVPVLAAGRVVDDLRRPIAGVDVALTGAFLLFPGTITPMGPRAKSAADGTFALVGTVQESPTKLLFTPPPGYASTLENLPADDRELEVALPRTGRILGTVSADFTVMLYASARATRPGERSASLPEAVLQRAFAQRDTDESISNWAFTFELRPGRYDVLVTSTPNSPRSGVIARVDDLEVRPGEVTVDPRLAPLTVVRERVTWRIHLSRSDGAPPPTAWVRLAPPEAPSEPWRNDYVATGESTFESSLESAWIDVDAVSFKRVHELHGRGDVTIVLEPLEQRDVEIALDAGEAPHCYDLHWIVAADSSRPLPSSLRDNYSTTVIPGGTSRLSLDEGERWKLRLFAQIDAGGAPRRVEFARCAQDVSTLGEASETPAKLSIVVHADEVDAVWQELSRSDDG